MAKVQAERERWDEEKEVRNALRCTCFGLSLAPSRPWKPTWRNSRITSFAVHGTVKWSVAMTVTGEIAVYAGSQADVSGKIL